MKIGGGGLQAITAQESARTLDAARLRPTAGEELLQSEDLAMRRMRYELNKAVENMRRAAEMYNQPLDFVLIKEGKPRIKAKDRRTGSSREFTLEEAEAWLDEMKEKKGRILNGYV
ncbi:hypothetical protein ACOBQJ_07215 [Pelotomaculum propionicicum]|uniref:hypothetical protein n=1 Tax=Pelotomaculum propionicicum TaxID=258475 RepID=UPI003B7B45F7